MNILEKYHSVFGKKIKIIDQINSGAGSARNKALDIANGEFIKFVDADDYLDLTILEKMVTIANENKVKLVRGNYTTVIGPLKFPDANNWSGLKGNQIVNVSDNKDYIIKETPGIGNKLIHRDLLDNLRFPENTKWEDLAIMPVVVASSKKLFHIDEPIYNFRVHINTTVYDFVKAIPNVLDIFKCVETLEKNMINKGLGSEYVKQIEGLYILHMLFRVENAMMWVNFSKDKKKVVINSIVNLIELKYPNWMNNEYITKYKQINPVFNFDINRIENYLDDSLRQEQDYNIISQNVDQIFNKKSKA